VLAKITECGLSERHARALLNIPDTEMRLQAAETIAKKNLSVRQTEELVERLKQDVLMNSSRNNIRTSFNYRIYTNTIKQAYDAILKTGKQAEYEKHGSTIALKLKS
jgi:ParB family chromosome partitioning protein